MHPDLEKLVRLQRTETDLRRVEGDLSDIPRKQSDIAARLAEDRGRVEACREALAASQKTRRQQEAELQDLEQKRSRYKGQLMEVKTNKEYTAMLHEIEAVEREIRAREDQILVEMERAETLGTEIKREEGVFKAAEERQRTETRALEERRTDLERQVAALRIERDHVAAQLPEDTLELFNRVARYRGSGVAEARSEMCQMCHVKLRPQMFVDVKRNEGILQCPSCSRILYYEAPAPTVSPEP